jgi:SNF2 family DNA or RNA helicase
LSKRSALHQFLLIAGVRQITAPYKLVLTVTPIKNRLPDVFRLAWWATGGKQKAHARFPYPDSTAAREQFASQFLVSERNLTKEAESGGKSRRFKKLTPQVCNVHRLWKMFAPIILRRRKANFGEDIVTKTRHIVRAPLGKEQAEVYSFHPRAKYRDKNGGPAIGAQLRALRVAAANSASELLVRPYGDGAEGEPRAKKSYIPKLHSALKLIQQCIEKGEQAVVFSAFHDSLDILSARLTEAGVPHCIADGRTSQKRRGHLASQFKLGPGKSPFQVMLAGVECMAEGHSFPLCNNVILLAYSWAYDKFEQAINRVHRLNSRWPVTVFAIICERSIDRKLEAMVQEKGDACELVLDGHLIGEQSEEVNLAELLEIAKKEFEEGGTLVTIDEKKLEKDWPPLRSQLSVASKGWRLKGLDLIGLSPNTPAVAIDLSAAPAADADESNDPVHVPACRAEAEVEGGSFDIQGEDLTMFAGLPPFELA